MRYRKLDLSFGDKMRLLFFGIVDERKLPKIEVTAQIQESPVDQKPSRPPLIELSDEINTKDTNKLDIPFFDLGDDDVNTNF